MKFLIVVEKTRTGFSSYAPDVPGCAATGGTCARVESAMKRAMRFHLDGMREQGLKVPTPRSYSKHVEVPA